MSSWSSYTGDPRARVLVPCTTFSHTFSGHVRGSWRTPSSPCSPCITQQSVKTSTFPLAPDNARVSLVIFVPSNKPCIYFHRPHHLESSPTNNFGQRLSNNLVITFSKNPSASFMSKQTLSEIESQRYISKTPTDRHKSRTFKRCTRTDRERARERERER